MYGSEPQLVVGTGASETGSGAGAGCSAGAGASCGCGAGVATVTAFSTGLMCVASACVAGYGGLRTSARVTTKNIRTRRICPPCLCRYYGASRSRFGFKAH